MPVPIYFLSIKTDTTGIMNASYKFGCLAILCLLEAFLAAAGDVIAVSKDFHAICEQSNTQHIVGFASATGL